MNVEIQSRAFALTPALSGAIQSRLSDLDAHFGSLIVSVSVYLDDINGHRGGIDKSCRVIIDATPRIRIVGQAVSVDMYHAIGLAARRAESALSRRIGRRRGLRPPAPAADLSMQQERRFG